MSTPETQPKSPFPKENQNIYTLEEIIFNLTQKHK